MPNWVQRGRTVFNWASFCVNTVWQCSRFFQPYFGGVIKGQPKPLKKVVGCKCEGLCEGLREGLTVVFNRVPPCSVTRQRKS